MSSLQDFYLNEAMRNDVKLYLVDFLKQEALKKVFDREDVSSVAEAKEMIDKAFENMEVLFTPKSQSKEIKNEAR